MDDIRIIDSFITGSRAYGTPRPDSDLDIAVLCDNNANLLWQLTEKDRNSCRFGKLNLITFTNKNNFERWRKVTNDLIKRAPVTRDVAIKAFQDANFNSYGEEDFNSYGEEDL